jgi:hypothetical protein
MESPGLDGLDTCECYRTRAGAVRPRPADPGDRPRQCGALAANAQACHALPPAGQLGGFNRVGALCVARQVFENRRRFEGIADGDPSNVKSNACLCPLENGHILDRP